MKDFHSLEVVNRVKETQLQVGENSNAAENEPNMLKCLDVREMLVILENRHYLFE